MESFLRLKRIKFFYVSPSKKKLNKNQTSIGTLKINISFFSELFLRCFQRIGKRGHR